MDNSGRDDVECVDLDGNDLTDDEHLAGGGSASGETNVGTILGGSGSQAPAIQTTPAPGGGNTVAGGNPNEEKTEVHHIVEQCQATKSGFSRVNIDGARNKVRIPQSVHRKISGYYSSKPTEYGGLRVRDWLAGQSFEFQFQYGMKILEKMWLEVFGK